MIRRVFSALLLSLLVGCGTGVREPTNLQLRKQALIAYVESGEYDRQITTVVKQAREWIEQRASRSPGRLAVVFDLDETLFRNWSRLHGDDFGYVTVRWDAWVEAAKAPAIEPVRELYQVTRRLGLDVIFVTGRWERQRAATEVNLRALGIADFAMLICKADGYTGTTEAFKTATRQWLAEQGWVLVANIGDQESDLEGGNAERTFKLPNPFYLTK